MPGWPLIDCLAGRGFARNHSPVVGLPLRTAPRIADGIVVAGQSIHTRTSVGLWTDPGGYDVFRVERRFAAFQQSDW